MANVYTKRYHRSRTTTLRDFTGRAFDTVIFPRILSPTRRTNPHPVGLVTQSPYNRDNTAFDIWNPSPTTLNKSLPQMIKHLGFVNFTCGPANKLFGAHAPKGAPPKIKYAKDSISRRSYCPQDFEEFRKWKGLVKNTRFGHTPDFVAARGIVPSYLPASDPESDC